MKFRHTVPVDMACCYTVVTYIVKCRRSTCCRTVFHVLHSREVFDFGHSTW